MNTYTIRVEYETGSTNGHYDASTEVGEWHNLDAAKVALKRLSEHYKWYDGRNVKGVTDRRPRWMKGYDDYNVPVPDDDGNTIEIYAGSWCGYFERCYGMQIVPKEDPEMKVTF